MLHFFSQPQIKNLIGGTPTLGVALVAKLQGFCQPMIWLQKPERLRQNTSMVSKHVCRACCVNAKTFFVSFLRLSCESLDISEQKSHNTDTWVCIAKSYVSCKRNEWPLWKIVTIDGVQSLRQLFFLVFFFLGGGGGGGLFTDL